MKRVRGIVLVALLLLGGVGGVVWWLVHPGTPQVITLPNGWKYQLSAMSYGTNHVHGPLGTRLADRLPKAVASLLRGVLGNHPGQPQTARSGEPSLCIWFDPLKTEAASTNGPPLSFSAMLANENGALAGTRASAYAPANQPFYVQFWVIPRRTRVLDLVLFQSSGNQPEGEFGRVRLPNQLFGRFPQWQPDTTVPAVKVVGDLEVHLDNFLTGLPVPNSLFYTNGSNVSRYRPAQNGEEAQTAFDVSFKPLSQAKGSWVMDRAELSDATGNHLFVDIQQLFYYQYRNSFNGTLWPDESAWRLKLGIKKRAPDLFSAKYGPPKFVPENLGIRPEELVTFTNVPVLAATATGSVWRTNVAGGKRIVLREYVQEWLLGGGTGFSTHGLPKFHAECADDLEGTSVDFVEATSPEGERQQIAAKIQIRIGEPSPRAGSYHFFALMSPTSNVPSVNLTWLVQKPRPVEFLLKPPPP